jgi:hypothetical protein
MYSMPFWRATNRTRTMPHIRIHREHDRDLADLCNHLRIIVSREAGRRGARVRWLDEGRARVSATGVSAKISIEPHSVRAEAVLSFLLIPLRHRIESEAARMVERAIREAKARS